MQRNMMMLLLVVFFGFLVVVGVFLINDSDKKQISSINDTNNTTDPFFAPNHSLSKLNNKTEGLLDEKITKDEAIFIAKLHQGEMGFYKGFWHIKASLSKDSKFWNVSMYNHDSQTTYITLVNAVNGTSKLDNEKWKSFSELKAFYIGDLYRVKLGKESYPSSFMEVSLNGKKIWKITLEVVKDYGGTFNKYVYFDPSTGKSKFQGGEWRTLKELDAWLEEDGNPFVTPSPFRDALRDLYPE